MGVTTSALHSGSDVGWPPLLGAGLGGGPAEYCSLRPEGAKLVVILRAIVIKLLANYSLSFTHTHCKTVYS